MYDVLLLNGQWQLNGKNERGEDVCISACVPGYVHPALEAAGIIEPIYWRKNAEKCQWVENIEWTYSRNVCIPSHVDLSRAELRIGGIDTYADIFVNGTCVYTSQNMYVPVIAPVNKVIKHGDNEVKIVIHPYRPFVENKPKGTDSAFSDDRIHVRRIQCTFFWDWVNRFVSSGIIGNVELAFPSYATIKDVFAKTHDFCATSAAIDLRIALDGALEHDCRFKATITDPDGVDVWTLCGRVYTDTLYLQADVPEPQLWWPAGYGEQPLYTLCVTLLGENGDELDVRSKRIGIRTARFERLQDKAGSDEEKRTKQVRIARRDEQNTNIGESYILLINGQRIFSKGGNWVPASPFVADITEERYYNLVRLVRDGSMNTLRVWGGGIYESDDFYDACDELGVMVMQDFILSCGTYPDTDPEFNENFSREVEAVIMRLRSRTSLVAWLGNNENGDNYAWDDKNTRNIRLSEGICRSLLVKLDPERTFRTNCPYGGSPNTDFTVGDNHVSWWWTGAEKITTKKFDVVGRYASESPLEGYSFPTVLRKFLTDDDIFDFSSPVLDYHIKNNYYFTDMGLISVHDRLKRNSELMIGTHHDKLRQLYRWSYIQYEWARFTLEGIRRAKWYSAGVLYWMYNDCWPALGYAVVDFYERPKAGWYATKYSGASVAATIGQNDAGLEFIVLNDSFESGEATYKVSVWTKDGGVCRICEGKTAFASNSNTTACRKTFAELGIEGVNDAIVFFDVCNGGKTSRARWYPDWLAKIDLADCELDFVLDREARSITVTCKTGIAIGVAFDGELIMDDNFFDLLEGESRTVSYTELDGLDTVTAFAYNAPTKEI